MYQNMVFIHDSIETTVSFKHITSIEIPMALKIKTIAFDEYEQLNYIAFFLFIKHSKMKIYT